MGCGVRQRWENAGMRAFSCPVCSALTFFDNSQCLSCGTGLGYDPASSTLIAVIEGSDFRRCANSGIAACNWVLPSDSPQSLCECCRLTRTRPADDDLDALAAFAEAEGAKRRLLYQLHDLGLPITSRQADPERGLAFDLLSSRDQPVTIGHELGIIQMDLAESNDAHREQVRESLGEAYRTVLGHLRHEIGHYYWMVLVEQPDRLAPFRDLFGDERADYGAAIGDHYGDGAPAGSPDWEASYISSYATMHPWEDWAETFAHYLHIRDTLQTAASYGLMIAGPDEVPADLTAEPETVDQSDTFADILAEWLPLTFALNAVNRSMGKDDLYPFTINPPVVSKLTWVHQLVGASRGSLGLVPTAG
jgi:hypothetical protein